MYMFIVFSLIHSKHFNIRWIKNSSYYKKNMSSIILYPVFYKYKNLKS